MRAPRADIAIDQIPARRKLRDYTTMQTSMAFWYAIWILVPMIPAIVLFKVIPSDASATGPLFGLRWKLGGSFAGYVFILLASNLWFISDIKKAILEKQSAELARVQQDLGEPWTIVGHIKKSDSSVKVTDALFTTQPPDLTPRNDFSFSFPILLPRVKKGDANVVLTIDCPPYQQVVIPIPNEGETPEPTAGAGPYRVVRKADGHVINIDPMIVLEPASTYKP